MVARKRALHRHAVHVLLFPAVLVFFQESTVEGSTASPMITFLDPTVGPAGPAYPIRVTIRGSGFTPNENTVKFGTITLPHLPSTENGTRIVFLVPKTMPSSGEVPPMVLPPGDYHVTVINANGVSNTKTFTLTRSP